MSALAAHAETEFVFFFDWLFFGWFLRVIAWQDWGDFGWREGGVVLVARRAGPARDDGGGGGAT